MKILDSDHCIAVLRGELDLGEHVAPDEPLAVTSINVAELAHGAIRSARAEENINRLEVLLSAMSILSFDEYAARRFGTLKAYLEREGNTLADLDIQIASIALEHGLSLVTHNQKHFSRVHGLILEDWIEG